MKNKPFANPERFKESESMVDTILNEWYSIVRDESNPELESSLSELSAAFLKFQDALTEAGFKGHWCGGE